MMKLNVMKLVQNEKMKKEIKRNAIYFCGFGGCYLNWFIGLYYFWFSFL